MTVWFQIHIRHIWIIECLGCSTWFCNHFHNWLFTQKSNTFSSITERWRRWLQRRWLRRRWTTPETIDAWDDDGRDDRCRRWWRPRWFMLEIIDAGDETSCRRAFVISIFRRKKYIIGERKGHKSKWSIKWNIFWDFGPCVLVWEEKLGLGSFEAFSLNFIKSNIISRYVAVNNWMRYNMFLSTNIFSLYIRKFYRINIFFLNNNRINIFFLNNNRINILYSK